MSSAEARGDVAKRQRFGEVDEVAQTAAERADDRLRDVRVRPIKVLEIRTWEENEPRFFRGHRGRRIHAAVEQGQLADGASGTLHVQHLLAPLRVRPVDAHLSRLDDVQAAALFPVLKSMCPELTVREMHRAGQLADVSFIQLREDRDAPEQRNERGGRRCIHLSNISIYARRCTPRRGPCDIRHAERRGARPDSSSWKTLIRACRRSGTP